MRYLKPLRPFFAWSQLSIPTVYDDSLSYYEVLNKCIFHFNEMLKIMQENYEIIDEAFAKILEECEAAIARCEEAAARAEAAQSAAEKAQAAAEAAQAAAEAAQKLAEAAQAAAEAARDDAVTAQKAAEAAQAAAEAAQAAAEAAQQKAETAQTAAEAAQSKAEAAQEKAESAKDAAQAAQTAAEAAQQKAETAQAAAESAQDAAQAAQTAAESARDAAQAAQTAAESARDEAQAAQTAAEAAQTKAEAAQEAAEASEQAAANSATNAAESASNAAESASSAASDATNAAESAENASNSANQAAESATDAADSAGAAHTSETNAADSAADAAASAEEIKNALDNYYDKTESDAAFVKKAGDTMTGKLVMESGEQPNTSEIYLDGASKRFKTILLSGNQDFNTLTNNGIYCRAGGDGTDTNAPVVTRNFILVVLAFDKSNTIIKQLYFTSGTTPVIYVRFIYTSEEGPIYGNWEKIATTEQINNSLSGYLPLTGGTMTGKINVQDELNDTFTGLSKGNYVTSIRENSDLNNVKTNSINFYKTDIAISEDSKNFPDKISGFLITIAKDDSSYIRQIYYATNSNDIYTRNYRFTITSWSNWEKISLNEEPTNGTPIFYKRVYSTDNKFFANIYKIAGDETKAKVDIYVNILDSRFNLSFSTDYTTFPAIFKIDGTQSTFNGEDLPFELKTTMDLVIGNYMVEKGSKYIGLVNLNYIIGFSGGSSYIKPYFNGILLESSVLNRGTTSGNYPVFITSFINNVNSSWSWD